MFVFIRVGAFQRIHKANNVIYRPYLRPGAAPFLLRAITRRRNVTVNGQLKQKETYQTSLLYDGIHPVPACKDRWAKTLKRALSIDYNTFI